MRPEPGKISKSSWPKVVARKWLNIHSGADEYHSDYAITDKAERRKSCSDENRYVFVPGDFSERWLMEATDGFKHSRCEPEALPASAAKNLDLRMFVGTWNVGGKSPHKNLNLRDWLKSPALADIYVLGFQEIVPLNAGNVLGAEDKGPAAKWLSLIRQALNTNNNDIDLSQIDSTAANAESRHSSPPMPDQQASLKTRLSFSDLLSLEDELVKENFEGSLNLNPNDQEGSPSPPCMSLRKGSPMRPRYCLLASKQMVGIFLCVWVRADLRRHISNLKVSGVGTGLMGYLGNKGSISVSMTLHQTTFCFVCTHLTSGEKEGNEVRRNSDVSEILKKTRFSRSYRVPGQPIPPDNILEHDKIIWLGDLNYRLAAGSGDTHELIKNNDWPALLHKDQLRIEQRAGRVFAGWEEGRIFFAPTYKYLANSDHYVFQASKSKEKQRTPAWCDRILWKGEGIKQIWYARGESRFSDHRPVHSLFSVKVDLAKTKPNITTTSTWPKLCAATALTSSCLAKVQAEEFLLLTGAQDFIDTAPK